MPELWPRRKLAHQDTLSEMLRATPVGGTRQNDRWSRRKRKRQEGGVHGIFHGTSDVCEGQVHPGNARKRWALDRRCRAPGVQERDGEAAT
eukprot:6760581-Heterocapsa_arctica.AAC.1